MWLNHRGSRPAAVTMGVKQARVYSVIPGFEMHHKTSIIQTKKEGPRTEKRKECRTRRHGVTVCLPDDFAHTAHYPVLPHLHRPPPLCLSEVCRLFPLQCESGSVSKCVLAKERKRSNATPAIAAAWENIFGR